LFHALDSSVSFWRRLLAGASLAAHFGGAFLAAHFWRRIFGAEFFLRILSCVCSAQIFCHVHIASEGAAAIIYE